MADTRSGRTRTKVKDFNELICCKLCKGYLIDATTVVECLHSFCRTCIISHLESNVPNKSNKCPSCDQQIHKTKPKDYIRSDPTLQDIVYKLVPGLYKNEMERRKEFYSREPKSAVGLTNEEKGELSGERLIFTPEDHIYLSIEYFPQVISYSLLPYAKTGETGLSTGQLNGKSDGQRRYLKCEGAMRVIHLKKWLKNKYNIRDCKDIEIFYKYDPLLDDYTMIDLAYIFSWRRNGPLCLYYKIVEPKSNTKETKKLKPKMPSKAKVPKVSNGPKKVTNGSKAVKTGVKMASVKPKVSTNGLTNSQPLPNIQVIANGLMNGQQVPKKPKNPFKVSTFKPKLMTNGAIGDPSVVNEPINGLQSPKEKPLVSVEKLNVTEAPKEQKVADAEVASEVKTEVKVASVKPKLKPTNKKRKSLNESNLITTNPVNEPLPPVDSALMTNFEHMLSNAVKKKKKQQKQKTRDDDVFRLLCNTKVPTFTVNPYLFAPPTEPLNLCAPSKRESTTPVTVPEHSPKVNGTETSPTIQCNAI